MKELLTDTVFEDTNRIREILLESKSVLESGYTGMCKLNCLALGKEAARHSCLLSFG